MMNGRKRSNETQVTSPISYDTDDDDDIPPPPPPQTPPPISHPHRPTREEIPPPPPLTDIPLSTVDEESLPEQARKSLYSSPTTDYGTKKSSEPPEVELELRIFKQLERARNKEEENSKKKRWKKPVPPHVKRRNHMIGICIIVFVLIAVAVGLGVGLMRSNSGGGSENVSSSSAQGAGNEPDNIKTTAPVVTNCLSIELLGLSSPLSADATSVFEQEYCAYFKEYYSDAGGTVLQSTVDVTGCKVDVDPDPAEICPGASRGRRWRALQGTAVNSLVLTYSQSVTYETPPGSTVQLLDVLQRPFESSVSREDFVDRLKLHKSTSAFLGLMGVSEVIIYSAPSNLEEDIDAGDEVGGNNEAKDGSDAMSDPDSDVPVPSPSPAPEEDYDSSSSPKDYDSVEDDGDGSGTGDSPMSSSPEEAAKITPSPTPKPTRKPVLDSAQNPDSGPKSKPKPDAQDFGWDYVDEILSRTSPPQFPDAAFFVTDFGADDFGREDSTSAFTRAIKACNAAGGGKVVVPAGTYRTGPIHLKSNVNFHVMKDATIEFSTDEDEYLPLVLTRFEGIELYNYSPLIYAVEQENVAITGEGVLDGGAADWNWWEWYNEGWQWPAYEQLLRKAENGVVVKERRFGDNDYLRPNFIQPYRCKNVLIQGVTIRNSPMWAVNPVLSTNVIVRGVTVESDGPDNDGVSIESCEDVLVEDFTCDVREDCISIKSGRNADGRRLDIPSMDIVIRNIDVSNARGGLTVGSEVSGNVRNVYAQKLKMDDVGYAFRVKTNSVRGGVVENINLRDTAVEDAREAVIHIDFHYAEGDAGEHDPLVQKIEVRDLTCKESEYGLFLRGYERATIKHIRLINVDFGRVDERDIVEHVEGLKIRD